MDQQIKVRVINRYRGEESALFGGNAVPEGAKLMVSSQRARELITQGLALPIVGPSETKPMGPAEKKAPGGTAGPAVPSSSSRVAPVSHKPTAMRPRAGKTPPAGASSPSKTTSGGSRARTSSTAATPTTGARATETGAPTSTK